MRQISSSSLTGSVVVGKRLCPDLASRLNAQVQLEQTRSITMAPPRGCVKTGCSRIRIIILSVVKRGLKLSTF